MGAQELKHQAKLEHWKEQTVACRSSGMSVRKWCIEHHVNQKTYYRWEKELLAMVSTELAPATSLVSAPAPVLSLPCATFAEVAVQPTQPSAPAEMVASIRIGKAKVDIYSGADASVVKALCQVLKSC